MAVIHWCLANPWIVLVAMAVAGMLMQWYERKKK
jgi:undecaprenyl pyrophosphate phosphatase UppP